MSKRYDVVRREQTGDKTRWVRVGVVFLNDDGDKEGGTLKLDMFGEKYYLFPPKERD